jgi:hypothetical protein
MAATLIFNFDGTGNEPKDAVQDQEDTGEIEDDNITNILKFHLLLGGKLKGRLGKKVNRATNLTGGKVAFYYNGVGTYGNVFQRAFNAGLSKESQDVASIINDAMDDFNANYKKSQTKKTILITGFSRGGAIARRFASLINDKLDSKTTVYEGIFDTVASIGIPNLSRSDRPKSDVLFENCTLPSKVEKALHLVSLDEKRSAFQPTLMNQQEGVREVWFAGAHSDVGGGYYRDGLSDISLRFFLDWFEDLGLGIELKTSKTIDYKKLVEKEAGYKIKSDDVQIDPNPFGVNHQQERSFITKKITLSNRRCCVIREDKVTEEEPIVHWSVAERIAGDRDYKPKSLVNVSHQIRYSDGRTVGFVGCSEHKFKHKRKLEKLENIDNNEIETKVFAYKKYNHTRILFEEGKSYKIEVLMSGPRWSDGGIKNLDGRGWDRKHQEFSWVKNIIIKGKEDERRVKGDNVKWFTLCGSIGDSDETTFVIENKTTYKAEKTGEFCAFANDLDGYYGNNRGKLKIKVSLA